MNDFDAFITTLADPLTILAGFDRQAATRAGIKPATVTEWNTLHRIYFGPTRFRKKQRQAVAIARDTKKTFDQLALIEHRTAKISDPAEKWALRVALLSVRGNYETLKRQARQIVPDRDDRPAPAATVRFTGSRKNMRTCTITGDEHTMAALEYALRRGVAPDRAAGPQMYEAFVDVIAANGDGNSSSGGVGVSVARPMVLIALPDYTKILAGEGDDVVLGLSNGTTMTGAQYLNEVHGAQLGVGLFAPEAGAVNLYREQRLANAKQRDLARLMLTTCPVPGCRHAADNCEVHHVTAWSQGGETNMANLSVLCRYHNRTNDDDPKHRHRGRIVIRAATPTWVSPGGVAVKNDRHPYGAMHQLFGA
ncbi:HNH endonuclease signature motif containing protein [Corynebacterium sp. P8-C1]|uniref:HNH endonuclease signature motif containing protein n=1 Tax=Corynebacterium sp. P8-C1 TaxID=3059082 RepID=UPI00265D238B|nr:HNH endonuclease signature motif containing protein [Corynebacterium sp. P8-C1]WKK63577.1 HNH endonuclease signature motif containing protein [Corynebacterium sp. P8-C1]